MNIILEGLEVIEKDILTEKLKNKYGFPILKKSTGNLSSYLDFRPNIIYDRHFISEWVFQKVYNRPAKILDGGFEFLKRVAINHNSIIIIFVCSNMQIIYDRLADRGEYEYFKEMEDQQKYFIECTEKLLKDYPNLYIIDIAQENAYERLDNWIIEKIGETK